MLKTFATENPVMAWRHDAISGWWHACTNLGETVRTSMHSIALHSHLSQVVLLSARPRVLVHMPFRIPALVFERTAPNLKQPHCHPRTNLRKLYALVSCPYEYMMPHFYAVFNVLECHHPATNFLIGGRCLARWEQMFENLHHTFSKLTVETLED